MRRKNNVFRKTIALFILLLHTGQIFANGLMLDPNSKYNTKLDKSKTGVPIVNVATPSNRGISINEFLEYNIDKEGQVLNNADNVGRSHLAGLINGNPNFKANQAANLIVLQVNGSNRSQIEGYLEALSRKKVDVVLSNENGIYINNSGTINIKNFTATTGKIKLQDGDYVGVDVEKGLIAIGPKGMDLKNTNYVEILSKTLEVAGKVVTDGDLKVVAGSNKIRKDGTIEKIDNSTNSQVAIDATNLGGMYANTIRIISTDKGAGVNSDSFIISKNNKLEITADGKIKVNKVQGKGIKVKGDSYEQKESALSDEEIIVNAKNIKLSGTGTEANKKIELNGDVENNASIYTKESLMTKSLISSGNIEAKDKVLIDGNLENSGSIKTAKNLKAKNVKNTKEILVKENIDIANLSNDGNISTDSTLKIDGKLNNTGNIKAIDKIDVKENILNKGEILTNNTLTSKDVVTSKRLIAKNGVDIASLDNSGIVRTDKKLNIKGKLENSGEVKALGNILVAEDTTNSGDILTNGAFTSKDVETSKKLIAIEGINTNKLENSGIVATNKNLNVSGNLENKDKGNVKAGKNILVTKNTTNNGSVLTGETFTSKDTINTKDLIAKDTITVDKLENSGNLITDNEISINGTLKNSKKINAINKIEVTGNVENSGDILTNSTFTSKDIKTSKKLIAKNNISVGKFENTGVVATENTLTVNGDFKNKKKANIEASTTNVVGNEFINSGEIKGNNLSVKSRDEVSNKGKILFTENISLVTKKLNNNGELLAGKNIRANNTKLVNKNKIASNQGVFLNNSSIENSGEILSGTIEMKNATKFENINKISGNNVTLTTGNDINLVGTLHGENNLTIVGKNIVNNGKTTGKGKISIASNNFENKKELSAETLKVDAKGNLTNNNILSGKNVELKSNNLVNNDLIGAEENLSISAKNKVENTEAKTIYAGKKLNIKAKEILNTKGELLGGDIYLKADKVQNLVGTIQAENNITMDTPVFENIGEVTDLDKYEKYYVTWDGHELTEEEVEKEWKKDFYEEFSKRSNGGASNHVRDQQRECFNKIISEIKKYKYKSYLIPKYENEMRNYLGGYHSITTGTTRLRDIIVLTGKVRSKGKTNFSKILAGNNIKINSKDVTNKDGLISAGNTVKITSPLIKNIVSTGEKIKVKTGEEKISIDFWSSGKVRKKRHSDVKYRRRFKNDIFIKKIPILDSYGRPVRDWLGRIKYEEVEEYRGKYAYVTGLPSVIEGKNVIIKGKLNKDVLEHEKGIKKDNAVVSHELKTKQVGKGSSQTNSEVKIDKISNVKDINVINNKVDISANLDSIKEIKNTGEIKLDGDLHSSLFVKNVKPDAKYILETRLKSISLSAYKGSDYFLKRVGYVEKWDRARRLGDAFYENQLITKNITEKLGTAFINGRTGTDLVKYLIDSAKTEAEKQNLEIGKKLNSKQISNLTKDIIWYVNEKVDGVDVLVPKVYLSKNTLENIKLDSRNKIGGFESTIIKTDNFENNGALIGNGGTTIVEADSITNKSLTNQLSEIKGAEVYLKANSDIENIGGKISGTNLVAIETKNGDIVNNSTIEEDGHFNGDLDRTRFTRIKSVGKIESSGDVVLKGNNYIAKAGELKGKNIGIIAKNNIEMEAIKLSGEDKFGSDGDNYNKFKMEENITSKIAGENILLDANDILVKGDVIADKNLNIKAKGNVDVISSTDKEYFESRKKEKKSFGRSSSSVGISYEERNVASNLIGENVKIESGKDVTVLGSNLKAGVNGEVDITAKGDITQAGVKDLDYSYYKKSKSGLFGITKKSSSVESSRESAIKSVSLAGTKGIEYDSKHDLVLEGVNVVSTGNVKLKGNNVEINPLETKNWEEVKKSKKGFAFSSGGGSISLSYGKDKNSRKNTNVVQNASEITSAKNLEINADNNIEGKSVNLYGKDNIILNAKNDINLETANNSEEIKTKASSKRIGVTVAIKGELKKTYDNIKNVKKLVDPNKDTYGIINTASNLVGAIKDGASAVNTIMNEKYNPKANSAASSNLSPVSKDVKDYVTASIGLSSSKSSSKSYQEQVEKNKIASEGNIEIKSENSSVSIAGADIKAGKNVLISAKDKVELKAGEEKNEYSSSASSRGISVDVINRSVDLSASGQKGKGNGINYVNSKVEAGEDYTVTSKEIEHIGANVKANKINITGDKVVIASKQDTSKSKNSSYGGNIGIGASGVKSLSLNASKGKGNGSWVNEQTSLEAKNGGLIKADKVENTGAIISSESEENKLKVVADEIVVKDLKDKYKYENKGGGISATFKETGEMNAPNTSLVHDKVEREQTTKATATNTEFVINGEEKEAEDLGFNTNKNEAQEVTKDKEKHLNAELHTDLLGKDKRDELAKAGKKLKVVGETLVGNKSGNKLDNLKEGLFGVIVDDYRKKHEEEFKLVKEKDIPLDKKYSMTKALVTDFLISHGYKGKIPEIMLTDSEHSYTQDGKNKETGEKQTEKIFFSIHDLDNPEIGFAKLMTHEMIHLNTYNEGKGGEESSIYAKGKVGESKKEFSAKEKEEYLKEVSEKYPMTKTLEEQFAEAKNIPESERENWAVVVSENLAVGMGYRINAGGSVAFILNPDTGEMYFAETVDFGLGVGTPSIGYQPSVAYFPAVKSPKDLEGWITTFGGSIYIEKKLPINFSISGDAHFYDKQIIGGRLGGSWENSKLTKSINMGEMLGNKIFNAEIHGSRDYSKVISSQILRKKDINKYIKDNELNLENINGAVKYLIEDPNNIRKSETFKELNNRVKKIHKYQEEN